MFGHPENTPEVNEMLAEVGKADVVQVWCKGCEDFRPMNARYAKYLSGEIESCSICRDK